MSSRIGVRATTVNGCGRRASGSLSPNQSPGPSVPTVIAPSRSSALPERTSENVATSSPSRTSSAPLSALVSTTGPASERTSRHGTGPKTRSGSGTGFTGPEDGGSGRAPPRPEPQGDGIPCGRHQSSRPVAQPTRPSSTFPSPPRPPFSIPTRVSASMPSCGVALPLGVCDRAHLSGDAIERALARTATFVTRPGATPRWRVMTGPQRALRGALGPTSCGCRRTAAGRTERC